MRERLLTGFSPISDHQNGIRLTNKEGYTLSVDIISSNVLRIRCFSDSRPLPINTLFPTDLPSLVEATVGESAALLCNDLLNISLDWAAAPIVKITERSSGRVLHQDLPFRSYHQTSHGVKHHSKLDRTDIHFGLGEVAAPIDLSSRTFTMRMSDSAKYNTFLTDPLYKHTPFLITATKPTTETGSRYVGIYSSSNADSKWDVGQTIDEPWSAYKAFQVGSGGLEEYLIFGGLIDVLQGLAKLVGSPKMPPKWALGYLASSMGLAESDEPPAQTLLEGFIRDCERYEIPCSAMHLSSGYTVTKTSKGWSRNVFTMNKDRFPDFSGFCRLYHRNGMRIVPNIKPYLVEPHPAFAQLTKDGGTFYDPQTGESVLTQIWAMLISETLPGSWIDTTSIAGFQWWNQGASELIKLGVDGLWNDNDEYSLHEDEFQCAYNLPGLPQADGKRKELGLVGRSLCLELLGKASYDALTEHSPERRPFILTRSSSLGTKNYAVATWSGDNWTSWETLRGNVAQTINASLSLYHVYGSDVGGFGGPLPSPELFLRWVQVNSWHTRFSIHSFKPNPDDPTGQATVNSPWMYPKYLPLIREAIKRRYELIPYMHNLLHEGHTQSIPPVAWLGFPPFDQDSHCFTKSVVAGSDFWLGVGRILVAGVFEPGVLSRSVYLPQAGPNDVSQYFFTSAPYEWHKAGSTVIVPTPLEHIAIFVRSGSVVPFGKPCHTISPGLSSTTNDGTEIKVRPGLVELDDFRGVELFPLPGSEMPLASYQWIEDDGESTWSSHSSTLEIAYEVKSSNVCVHARWVRKVYKPAFHTLWVLLPQGDDRNVSGDITGSTKKHRDGRLLTEVHII